MEPGLKDLPCLLCRHEETHERSWTRGILDQEQLPGRGGSLKDGTRCGEEGMVHVQEVDEAKRVTETIRTGLV